MDVDDDLVGALQVDVEQRQPVVALEPGEPGLDDEGLAEDAGGLGECHREPTLERRAIDQRGVVIGVAEFVGGGLRRLGRARPVQQHERAVADVRHAERPARLAVGGRSVDPALGERSVDEPAEGRAEPAERRPDDGDALVPAQVRRRDRQRGDQVPPGEPGADRRGRHRLIVGVQAGLHLHPGTEVGQRGTNRGLHRIERGTADAVGEQRRVERRVPVAATIDGVRLRP